MIKLSYRPNANRNTKKTYSEIPLALQEIPLTPTSQTARAHGSSLSERVSDTRTVPPGIPHSTDHTNWAMSWSTSLLALRCRNSPIVTLGSNRCITSPGTAPRKIGGGMVMHTSSATVLLREHLSQPHSRSLQAVRTISLTMNHVLSRRLVLQERFPPSPLCVPPLPFLRSPAPSTSLLSRSRLHHKSSPHPARRDGLGRPPPLMGLRLAPPMGLRRHRPDGAKTRDPPCLVAELFENMMRRSVYTF